MDLGLLFIFFFATPLGVVACSLWSRAVVIVNIHTVFTNKLSKNKSYNTRITNNMLAGHGKLSKKLYVTGVSYWHMHLKK